MTTPQPPSPEPDDLSAEFWEQARHGVLAIQRCERCGAFAHPPVALCDRCEDLTEPSFSFEAVSGRGHLVSWTVIRRALVRGFEDRVPVVFALVELNEQADLRIAAELLCQPNSKLTIGQPVEVAFDDGRGRTGIPFFQLSGRTGL